MILFSYLAVDISSSLPWFRNMEVVSANRTDYIDHEMLSSLSEGDSSTSPSPTPNHSQLNSQPDRPSLKPKPKNIPPSVLRGLTKNPVQETGLGSDMSSRAVSMLASLPSPGVPAPQLGDVVSSKPPSPPIHTHQYPGFKSRPIPAALDRRLTPDELVASDKARDSLQRSLSSQEVYPSELPQGTKPRPNPKTAPSPLPLGDKRPRVQDLVSKFDAISVNNSRGRLIAPGGPRSPRRCVSAMTHREEHSLIQAPTHACIEEKEPEPEQTHGKPRRTKFAMRRKISSKPRSGSEEKEETPPPSRREAAVESPILERTESLYESKSLDRSHVKKGRRRKESFLNFITGSPKSTTMEFPDCPPVPPEKEESTDLAPQEGKAKKKKSKGRNIMKHVLRTYRKTGSPREEAEDGESTPPKEEKAQAKKKRRQTESVSGPKPEFENTVEIDLTRRARTMDASIKKKKELLLEERLSSLSQKSQSLQKLQTDVNYTDLDDIGKHRTSWFDPSDSPLSQKRPGSKRDSAYDSEQSRGDSVTQEPYRCSLKSSSLADEILEQVGISRSSLVVVNDMYESPPLSDRPTPISITDEDQNSFNSEDEPSRSEFEVDFATDPLIAAPEPLYDDILMGREESAKDPSCSKTLTPVTPLDRSVSPSLFYENAEEDLSPAKGAQTPADMYDLPYEEGEKRRTLTADPRPSLFKISPLETSLERDLYESVEVSSLMPRGTVRPLTSAPPSVSHRTDSLPERIPPSHAASNLPKRPSTIFTTDSSSLYRATDIASVEAVILEATIACKKKSDSAPKISVDPPVETSTLEVLGGRERAGSPYPRRPPSRRDSGDDSFSDSSDNEDTCQECSYLDRSTCSSPVLMEEVLSVVKVMYSYEAKFPNDISLKEGDIMNVLDMNDPMWWIGRLPNSSRKGYFPCSYVQLCTPELFDSSFDEDAIYMDINPGDSVSPQKLNKSLLKRRSAMKRSKSNSSELGQKSGAPKLTQDEMRCRVIQELVSTENTYLQSLEIIIKCREECMKRMSALAPDSCLFTSLEIEQIFKNVEELHAFESSFMQELRECVKQEKPETSLLGNLFVRHEQKFKDIYTPYCTNQTVSSCRLCLLLEDPRHLQFFRSFTVLTTEDKLPIEAYLLKPVQKICKYHLQMKELLKNTEPSHPDYPHVEQALEVMREVTNNINEKKRRTDNLPTILDLQHSVDNWTGPDILDTSTTLLHSGKLYKISKGHSQERKFFLFDNLLVYCKEDALRTLKLKGRIYLNEKNIIQDVEDEQEHHNGIPLKNAWKIINRVKCKEYIIYTKDVKTKEKWLAGFRREREMVENDKLDNFRVSARDLEDALFVRDMNKKKKKKSSTARTKSLGFEFKQKSRSLGKEKTKDITSTDVVHSIPN